MGSEWDDEDSHGGHGPTPKLILAGRIDGVFDGRPVSLIAERQNLVLTVESWRTLRTIRHSYHSLIQALHEFCVRSDTRLVVGMGWLGRVEVHPNPSFWVRMLLPIE